MAEQRHYTEAEAEQILRLASQTPSGEISHADLMRMAGELGLSPDRVERAAEEFRIQREAECERQAYRHHVRAELINHVSSYFAINAGLLAMDFFKDNRISWALWPVLAWGMFVVFHIVSVLFPSHEQREKGFREWKAKQKVLELTDRHRETLDEIALAEPKGKIEAIKELRERLSLGLKDAKDLVDQYETEHPGVFRT